VTYPNPSWEIVAAAQDPTQLERQQASDRHLYAGLISGQHRYEGKVFESFFRGLILE